MAESFLPLELITEILTKLPVKSLHRFKCVSRTWNSIITSSKFIKQHLHQTLISNTNFNNNIIIFNRNSLLSSAISDIKLRFDVVNHPLNNLPHCPGVEIVESVHGVLLIIDSSKKTVCLFNLSNKTKRLVPPAPSHKPARDFGFAEVFGFGYDSDTDDYKVVRLVQWNLFEFDDYGDYGLYRETSVYSMRNDSWELFNDDTVLYSLRQANAVTVDQTLCFLVVSRDSKSVLKCFNLRTSTFSLVDFPEFDNNSGMMTFTSLRGCLCLLVSYLEHKVDLDKFTGNPVYNRGFLYADVWEMKDCKWVKLFRIRKNEICMHCMFLRLVTYSKDMSSVLIEVDNICFGWYDLVTKRFERVPVQGLRVEDLPFMAFTYVESLVSVMNNKVVSKKKTIEKNDFLSSGFKLKL